MSDPITFKVACFSTNHSSFSPLSIMKQYFMSTNCTNINNCDDGHIEFEHILVKDNAQKINCFNIYYEISHFGKTSKILSSSDCFIIFIDLENDNSLIELNKILDFMKEKCDLDKKIFGITIFTNENNIKKSLSEENIRNYFNKFFLTNYSIQEVDMDTDDELVKAIDSLTTEVLIIKKQIGREGKIMDFDRSGSGCNIF